jgi:hypothetical protein
MVIDFERARQRQRKPPKASTETASEAATAAARPPLDHILAALVIIGRENEELAALVESEGEAATAEPSPVDPIRATLQRELRRNAQLRARRVATAQ